MNCLQIGLMFFHMFAVRGPSCMFKENDLFRPHFLLRDRRKPLPLTDESYIMILYTRCDAVRAPENLKALYTYVNDPDNKTGGDLIERIEGL